jgi:hypothetical protein
MAKMYVGYDGNVGSAEDCDLLIFDSEDFSEAQLQLLDEDPADFYLRATGDDWEGLE